MDKLLNIKETEWYHSHEFWLKEIFIIDTSIDEVELFDKLSDNCEKLLKLSFNFALSEEKRHRNNGEEQSDYVAHIANMGGETATHSHYTRDDKPIQITLPDGSVTNGVLRLANHEGDIGTFAKNNKNIDFCISIVVGKKDRVNSDIEIEDKNRTIHIIEYVLDKHFENKEKVLMNIADRICDIKNNGWNINTDVGIKDKPNEKTNGSKIFEERISIILRKVLNEFILQDKNNDVKN